MTDKPDSRKARMAPRHDAPPGLEQDSHGNVIPLAERTRDDQDLAKAKKPQ